jgi:hypothetical protein
MWPAHCMYGVSIVFVRVWVTKIYPVRFERHAMKGYESLQVQLPI